MNYLKLVNRFWQSVGIEDFLPAEAAVYFRLLDICNRLDWRNPFALSNARAAVMMGMSVRRFRAVRQMLVERGLIRCREGVRRRSAPLYCFPVEQNGRWIFPEFPAEAPVAEPVAEPAAKKPAEKPAKPAAKPAGTRMPTKEEVVDYFLTSQPLRVRLDAADRRELSLSFYERMRKGCKPEDIPRWRGFADGELRERYDRIVAEKQARLRAMYLSGTAGG